VDVAVQISTGTPGASAIDERTLISRLEVINRAAPLTCALIGWNPEAWPARTATWLRDQGTAVFLWLPVFSGWDDLAPLVGQEGLPVSQTYRSAEGERFDFGCPANPVNVAATLRRFDEVYASQDYDGVFLDKIRFPSFIDGMATVATCDCSSCVSRFGPRPKLGAFEGDNPLGLRAYQDLRWEVDCERVAALFAYKAAAVTHSVKDLVDGFRERGKLVGLDLFAPFLSYFVGQDYAALSPLADFVKPMLYRNTNAPAGIPFELDSFAAAFGGSPADWARRKAHLQGLLGLPAIDLSFINSELDAARGVAGSAKVYAGFEVNRTSVAPITPAYVAESLGGLKADGFALSWDINQAPVNNVKAIVEGLRARQ